jgi:hypothetical protein
VIFAQSDGVGSSIVESHLPRPEPRNHIWRLNPAFADTSAPGQFSKRTYHTLLQVRCLFHGGYPL